MNKILVLDPKTIQLIAAGEVTENPVAVVKELVENSIDAHSTRITVEIENGGTTLIKVSDNGEGISRQDVEKAFLPHATSKLRTADDVNRISSLGFRGEALASISAVSRVEMITRSQEESIGSRLYVEAGLVGGVQDVGRAPGTCLCVRDLFYNTPARMKFLKKEVVEGNKVASVMDKLALSHPEILFKFIRDGREIFCSTGDGHISSAIYSVYGKNIFDSMISINYEQSGIKIKGFISDPKKCRPSRNMQIFFINNRLVKNKLISTALEEAFKNSTVAGKKPYCMLYLEIPHELVDVNIHPSKEQVRFANDKEIFDIVYESVSKALKNQELPHYLLSEPLVMSSDSETNSQSLTLCDFSFEEDFLDPTLPPKNITKPKMIPQNKLCLEPQWEEMKKSVFIKILGELFSCFILLQYSNKLIMVDKHAAHERIIFEKIKNNPVKYESQVLLRPITITLEKEEHCALMENLELLSEVGYELEDFGPGTVILRSAPMYEDFDKLESAIIEISDYILKNKLHSQTKKLEWIYNNISCRAAVKAGSKTSEEEIIALVRKLIKNPELRYCPHGRPIYVEFDKKFIEKRFGRN